MEHLSSIVEVLNDRFGTDLTDVDKLLLDQFEESWVADGELADQAQNNTLDNFRLVFDKKFLQTIITRVDANEEIFKKILDDEDFRATLGEFYLRKVYDRLQTISCEWSSHRHRGGTRRAVRLGVRRAAGGYELPFKTLLAGLEKTGSAGPLTLPLATGGLIPACLGPARVEFSVADDVHLGSAGCIDLRLVGLRPGPYADLRPAW